MSGDRSLFIVALPRTLSTLVHQQCSAALGLVSPRWTSAGEILNGDRLAVSCERSAEENPKFIPPESSFLFEQLTDFLGDVVKDQGHAYKDVVQPFVVTHWLAARPLAVLRIRRSLADVALSMRRAGWWFPRQAAPETADRLDGLLRGLWRASQALEALPAEVVEFDDLLDDGEALRSALRRLYPEREVPPLDYADEGFQIRRLQMLADRQRPEWRELEERLAVVADNAAS